jgi:ubiquinol-cytochrome c reductase cytochrome b subunit
LLKIIFEKIYQWLEDRTGLISLVGKMAKHPVPSGARWWYVFGNATLCAFLIQVVSGIALALYYIPSADEAYVTLQTITHNTTFGGFARALHYYGASAMVLMVGIHMAQVFLQGSYKFPREMNWLTGVLLLGFTLLMGFTGQILRWDQNAVWTAVVAAKQAGRAPLIGGFLSTLILGGSTVGGSTLSRIFVVHVFLIPALVFAFVGLHLLLVLRHGISEPPEPGKKVNPQTYRKEYEASLKKDGVPFWPDAVWRDMVFAAAMTVAIVVLAFIFGPPELGHPPDPSLIDANPRPDWYLMWYFAVLALLPHGIENFFMVFAPLIAGIFLILLPFISNHGERSPSRRPWAVAVVIMIVVMIGAFWWAGVKSDWSPNFDPKPLSAEVIGAASGPILEGAHLFEVKGCLNCHLIQGDGGRRGPDLSVIGDKLSANQMILRISNGATNMPAYASTLTPAEMEQLVAFLQSRRSLVKTP